MKSILLTITFLAAVATAKCGTPATETQKEVKTEKVVTPADATAKTEVLVGTSKANLSIVREGVKQA